jgi:MFS family permease
MDSARHRFFYGWWVVSAAAAGLFWGAPVTVFTFSVFVRPLMQDFHAGRATISLAYTLGGIAAACSAFLTGRLVDRFGARRVILPATALFAMILLSMKVLAAGIGQFYALYLALGFLVNGVGPVPYGQVVARWFDQRRGLALGLMMFGIGSGAMIMPALAQQFIASFGWRAAYAILGCAVLLIAMPVVAGFLKENPREFGLRPDGLPPADAPANVEADVGVDWRRAWRDRTFWLMAGAFFLAGASVHGCVVHLAPMLLDRGLSARSAALGSSLVGAAVLTGRVGSGYLLDRLFGPYLAAGLFGGVALGIGLLWSGAGTALMLAGAFLVGLGLGAEVDIIAYLTSRYFGLRSFGEIYGSAFTAFLLAGALGPLLMGKGFDLTGSYRAPLVALLASALAATLLITRLGPYRYQAGRRPDGPHSMLADRDGEFVGHLR